MTAQRISALLLALSFAGALGAAAQEPEKDAPTAATTVVNQEKAMLESVRRNEWAAFGQEAGADFVYVDPNGAFVWELSRTAELMKGCITKSLTTDNMQATPTAEKIMVVTYTATLDQVCQGRKAASPIYALSVWNWQGTRWLLVARSETPVPTKL